MHGASRSRVNYTEASLLDLANNQDLRPLAMLVRDVRAVDATADVMLAGAMARDVLLLHAYGVPLPRATTVVDSALAVEDWAAFNKLRDALLASANFISKSATLHKLVHTHLTISKWPWFLCRCWQC